MILPDAGTLPASPPAAHALTRGLPRDQALGLRLTALAHAAAATHMAAAVAPGATLADTAQALPAPPPAPHLLRTQAAALFARLNPLPCPPAPLPPC